MTVNQIPQSHFEELGLRAVVPREYGYFHIALPQYD